MTSSESVAVLRAHVERCRDEDHPIDPSFVLRLIDSIDNAEHELALHQGWAHDLDAVFDGVESVFERGHRDCTSAVVLGRLYRLWRGYATERGYVRTRRR